MPRRRESTPSTLEGDASAEPPLDARGLGTLVHAVLEEIDFARPGDIAERVRRLGRAASSGAERPSGGAGRDDSRFLGLAAGKRSLPPRKRFQEVGIPVGLAARRSSNPGGRYLQGFIDCLYRDAGGRWRLIDYKTNRGVTAETLAAKAAPYEMQMLVYALAAETILKSPPVELALCFLRPGLEHHFAWNAAARRRVVELVNQALP